MWIHVKYCKRHGQDTRPFVTYGSRLNFMFKSNRNNEFKMDFRKNKIKLWSRFIFFSVSLHLNLKWIIFICLTRVHSCSPQTLLLWSVNYSHLRLRFLCEQIDSRRLSDLKKLPKYVNFCWDTFPGRRWFA